MSDARHLSFKYLCLLPCQPGQLNQRAVYLSASQLVEAKATRQTMNRQRTVSIRYKNRLSKFLGSDLPVPTLQPSEAAYNANEDSMDRRHRFQDTSKVLFTTVPSPRTSVRVSTTTAILSRLLWLSLHPEISITFHAEGWLLCPIERKVFIIAGLPLLHRPQTWQCPTVAEVVLSG